MSSTNRRHGGSNRPPHLTVAPSPDSTAPTVTSTTSALAEEDAPLSTAGQVTIMLTPEEFMNLAEPGGETLTPSSSNEPIDTPAPEQTDEDEDAAFDRSTTEQTEIPTPELDTEPAGADRAPEDRTTAEATEKDARTDDPDPDPHFEQLANMTTAAPRALAAAGSASIDTPPIRPTRRTSSRAAPARRNRPPRRRRRNSILVVAAVITITVPAILIARSSNTNAPHQAPTVALSREQGLPDIQRSLEPISAELAAIARRSIAAGARRSSRQHTARHAQHRAMTHRQSISAVDRSAVATSQTSQTGAITAAPAAPTTAAITSTPARTVAVTHTSPAATTGHMAKSSSSPSQPPAYGEGGVLGAGHAG
ncbi:MAG: hypothetical protein ACLP8S_21785 [Solirubrobacteraceae bacterium]